MALRKLYHMLIVVMNGVAIPIMHITYGAIPVPAARKHSLPHVKVRVVLYFSTNSLRARRVVLLPGF